MDFDQALLALGTSPIPGDAPTGVSARYEPEFESMQAEIEKLSGLSGEAPNWAVVIDNATAVLAGKSKDLLAACYLCAGLREIRGWAGLADGLNLLKGLFTGFWEGLHPAKVRVRRTAIDWLLNRLKDAIPAAPIVPGDREAVGVCMTLVDELSAFGETRWEGDAPPLWPLTAALKERLDSLPAEAKPEVAEEADAKPQDSASQDPAPQARSAGGQAAPLRAGAVASRADAYSQILAAAEHLEAIEPHSPVPYLLRRAVAWGAMPLPQLYSELQRSGTVWDLVLQQPAAGTDTPSPVAAATVPPAASAPEPAPAETPAPQRRGDY